MKPDPRLSCAVAPFVFGVRMYDFNTTIRLPSGEIIYPRFWLFDPMPRATPIRMLNGYVIASGR